MTFAPWLLTSDCWRDAPLLSVARSLKQIGLPLIFYFIYRLLGLFGIEVRALQAAIPISILTGVVKTRPKDPPRGPLA